MKWVVNMIDKVLDIINQYLAGEYPFNENYPFYIELERLLFQNYVEMYQENDRLTIELYENLSRICEECELGFDEDKFKTKIINELKRIELALGLKLFIEYHGNDGGVEKMKNIEYPVECPLLNKKIDRLICFDIHGVVEGLSPKDEAPKEIYEHENYIDICYNCKYHIFD